MSFSRSFTEGVGPRKDHYLREQRNEGERGGCEHAVLLARQGKISSRVSAAQSVDLSSYSSRLLDGHAAVKRGLPPTTTNQFAACFSLPPSSLSPLGRWTGHLWA
jgi:hypothetical protein